MDFKSSLGDAEDIFFFFLNMTWSDIFWGYTESVSRSQLL